MQVTSHRMLPPFVVLGGALKCVLDRKTVHSEIICRRCFNLLDDIDSAEVQLTKMKLDVSNQYKNTLKNVGPPWIDIFESSLPVPLNPTERDISSLIASVGSRKKTSGNKEFVLSTGKRQRKKKNLKVVIDVQTSSSAAGAAGVINEAMGETSDVPLEWSKIQNQMLIEVKDELSSNVDISEETCMDDDGNVDFEEETVIEVEEPKLNIVKLKVHHTKMESERFKCPHCPKHYAKELFLEEHMNMHTGTKPFKCRHCDVAFPMAKMLRHHLAEHNDTEPFLPYPCGECDKAFPSMYKLSDHRKRAHGNPSDLAEEEQLFVCEVCGKVLGSSSALKRHVGVHTDDKKYQCDMCGSTFRVKGNLVAHVRLTHNMERPHQCDVCGRGFARSRMLKYHTMSAHTGERPHVCHICGAGFFISQHLTKHMRTKHEGLRPYICSYCHKSFSVRENMKMHMYTHTNIKPYECACCGVGFMRKQPLIAHIQDQHPELEEPLEGIKHNSEITQVEENMVIVEGYEDMEQVEIPIIYRTHRKKTTKY